MDSNEYTREWVPLEQWKQDINKPKTTKPTPKIKDIKRKRLNKPWTDEDEKQYDKDKMFVPDF